MNITSFKCPHCGNNDPAKAKYYDGAIGYEAMICDCCGWTFHFNGAHPPEAADLAKRVDWQKCQALICYAPNMYAFLLDLERYSGPAMEALAFIKGWVKGFKMKVNREGAELQKELAKYDNAKSKGRIGSNQEPPAARGQCGHDKGFPETPGNRSLEKF